MGDQRNTSSPEARIFICAWCAGRHFGCEFAFDHADMYAAFFKEAPAHHAARAAAAILDLAQPIFIFKRAGLARIKIYWRLAFQAFKFSANFIA